MELLLLLAAVAAIGFILFQSRRKPKAPFRNADEPDQFIDKMEARGSAPRDDDDDDDAAARRATPTAIEKSSAERQRLVGDTTAREPTEKMIAAVKRLGLGIDPATLTFDQASAVLGARDYAFTLAERTRAEETDEEINSLILAIYNKPELWPQIADWSWHTRGQYPRRIPQDDLRAACEQFLKELRAEIRAERKAGGP